MSTSLSNPDRSDAIGCASSVSDESKSPSTKKIGRSERFSVLGTDVV